MPQTYPRPPTEPAQDTPTQASDGGLRRPPYPRHPVPAPSGPVLPLTRMRAGPVAAVTARAMGAGRARQERPLGVVVDRRGFEGDNSEGSSVPSPAHPTGEHRIQPSPPTHSDRAGGWCPPRRRYATPGAPARKGKPPPALGGVQSLPGRQETLYGHPGRVTVGNRRRPRGTRL